MTSMSLCYFQMEIEILYHKLLRELVRHGIAWLLGNNQKMFVRFPYSAYAHHFIVFKVLLHLLAHDLQITPIGR